ncbi:alpha/beta hydrolase [Staphylococcus devriesei]|uniref:alpha/beta hydrolase n=1 Tax=Staphylococcus devriesei TaxID=586733 RepID=UPI001F271AF8|nr:alpha/beta hydrolase [Staphylococcus devriesei]MCE5089987.1 alpha/beta hydrolase [Staphylococcus devriesei]
MDIKKLCGLVTIVCIMLATLTGCQSAPNTTKSQTTNENDRIATLFMHGYGGTENSEKFIVNQAKKKGVTDTIVTAKVSSLDKVSFKGDIPQNATQPIVKIIFEDNKNGNIDQNSTNIRNVLLQLKTKYNISKYNFVAHSMGNLSFAYFMKNFGNNKQLPQLQKEVNIAGTYNGILNLNEKVNEISVDKNGKPSKMNDNYKELLELKDVYKDKHIDVLNIYGDLQDGTHSDGRVSMSSARSLKYLLGNSPASYKESKYTGKSAQHSQLHENKEVANEIINFLWDK